jgi:cell wall-associated NlpC family hydrolase
MSAMNKQNLAEAFSRPNDRIRLRLTGPSLPFDKRVTAIRSDLADVAASAHHFAPHYSAAVPFFCHLSSAMVHGAPGNAETAVSQILHGETFHVLDLRAGWAWGYCGHDHYVGYVPVDALDQTPQAAPTHRVRPGGALVFSRADIKAPVTDCLPGGALVQGATEDGFLAADGGYLHMRHLVPVNDAAGDRIATARAFLGMPYLWGGRGGDGIDCSGLVQMVLGFEGHSVPRDTDQQAAAIGRPLAAGEALAKGDLVYFPGHVGIMTDGEMMIHANAHWMCVTEEPLADVTARLASLHAQPILTRRRKET